MAHLLIFVGAPQISEETKWVAEQLRAKYPFKKILYFDLQTTFETQQLSAAAKKRPEEDLLRELYYWLARFTLATHAAVALTQEFLNDNCIVIMKGSPHLEIMRSVTAVSEKFSEMGVDLQEPFFALARALDKVYGLDTIKEDENMQAHIILIRHDPQKALYYMLQQRYEHFAYTRSWLMVEKSHLHHESPYKDFAIQEICSLIERR